MRLFNYFFQILLLSAFLVFVSCEADTNEHMDETEMHADGEHMDGEMHSNNEAPMAPPQFENPQVGVAFEHYIQLKNALVDGNADVANDMAMVTRDMLNEVPNSAEVRKIAEEISKTEDIEKQRTLFINLSTEMEKLVRSNKIIDGGIYKAYCPMANDDKGAYWLSNEKEIRNPYFGDKMLKCGEVKEVIR